MDQFRQDTAFHNCLTHHRSEGPIGRGWVLAVDGIIEDKGSGELPGHRVPSGTERRDLGGRYLLPGFFDAHMHLFQWSVSRKAVDLSSARSVKELIRLLKERFRSPQGDPFLGTGGPLFGVDYDDSSFTDGSSLDGSVLDEAFGTTPVMVRRICGHKMVCSSEALDMLGMEPSGPENGVLLEEAAMAASRSLPLTAEGMVRTLRDGVNELYGLGVVGGVDIIHGSMTEDVIRSYSELEVPPLISLSVHGSFEDGVRGPFGKESSWDDIVRCQPSEERRFPVLFRKFFADGSIGARTASFRKPYIDSPSPSPLMDMEELEEAVERSFRSGHIPMVHAIGDEAASQVLDVLENAGTLMRIEHMESVSNDDMKRLDDGRLVVCMQPNFHGVWGKKEGMYDRALKNGSNTLNRFASMDGYARRLCFGSDMMPPGPMFGIRSALSHPEPGQSLELERAIHLYSGASAFASLPKVLNIGSIRKGNRADLTVIDGELKVHLTMVGGAVVFDGSRHT